MLTGFSSAKKAWLPVNFNFKTINVDAELEADESHLKVFKSVVGLRYREAFRKGWIGNAGPWRDLGFRI
jgi:alpha-glucosidase